ncbi:MAG: Ureidoglycolate hydrolase [Cyanobacteriota bacterium]|jgi:hypothetical protein|nr:Ureidoglycolate hydrolase [Synechococcus sp. FGCU3]MEB3104404.1 Ureidoglycolate hydrolase [Cyanobacteriota bacterium]
MHQLRPTDPSPEAIAPYGQLVLPMPNGVDFGPGDAELQLDQGKPRFWLMALEHREPRVERLGRHSRCSQCLASADAKPWWIVLAPPQPELTQPEPELVRLFRIPAGVILKLHPSSWHAGPYFPEAQALFFNLELADTNSSDFTELELPQPLPFSFNPE